MRIRAWGPLFALVALFASGLAGLALQYTQHNNYSRLTKTENGISPNREAVAVLAPESDNDKGKVKNGGEESFKTTDWLLVLFNGLLALYTWRLYLATHGLVEAAHNQSEDIKASTKAATDAAQAAIASNQIAVYNAEQQLRAYVSALEVNLRLQRRANMIGAHQVINGPVHTYSVSVVLEKRRPDTYKEPCHQLQWSKIYWRDARGVRFSRLYDCCSRLDRA
jgi:hypothetical protein